MSSNVHHSSPKQIGENGHVEYGWSNNIYEKIVQYHFQLTRTTPENMESLEKRTISLLEEIQGLFENKEITEEKYIELMSTMYKIIGHTRDMIDGKGEYMLSYMLIYAWHTFSTELAEYALQLFVELKDAQGNLLHPYGSWKDMKYFAHYCKQKGVKGRNHPLVAKCIQWTNEQLRKDMEQQQPSNLSLVAKWIPREKSKKFGWLFFPLSIDFYKCTFIDTAKTFETRRKAFVKTKMEYRKMISDLNKKLDTVQIKQCTNAWSQIDPLKQTSITLHHQKRSFLNITKKGTQKYNLEDRIQCATHFQEFIEKASRDEVDVPSHHIGIHEFTKEALFLLENPSIHKQEIDLLNAQWRNHSKQTNNLCKMVAMVDISATMEGDPMNCAIALGIRVAEKSMLGKRLLTFHSTPTWIMLDDCENFVDMVEKIANLERGMNNHLFEAFDFMLDTIVEKKISPEEVENMTIVIFSDMQIDMSNNKKLSMYEAIEERYATAGLKLYNKPFKVPHILFWNVRSTNGFPVLSSQPNVSMVSGFNPSLLDLFCEKGLPGIHSYSSSPWNMLQKYLSNPRYALLEDKIKQICSPIKT
jgi:hypothetical protein